MTALARRTYEVLECHGMARVDFFLHGADEKLFVNEINTIPGITPISLFPQMWEASGMPFSDVVDRLIALALARHRRRAALETSFAPPTARRPRRTASPAGTRRRPRPARRGRR
jgi:D-alanine-D-alanine ligase